MKIRCNETHRFTKQFPPISEEDIRATPGIPTGESPETILARNDIPESVRSVIRDLPYANDRVYTWIYVRPQYVDKDKPDTRTGSFYHLDVDAIYRCVASSWEDFKELIVSFGDVSETAFISEPADIEVTGPPKSEDYVSLLPQVSPREWPTESPAPGQVAEYTIRDFHMAGPIRKTGWRLVIVVFQTNTPPSDRWPPV